MTPRVAQRPLEQRLRPGRHAKRPQWLEIAIGRLVPQQRALAEGTHDDDPKPEGARLRQNHLLGYELDGVVRNLDGRNPSVPITVRSSSNADWL